MRGKYTIHERSGPPLETSPPQETRDPFSRTRQRRSTARCQVQRCNADLRGGKDYHRRHRVCQIHSKAFKVALSGLEQRFCQQCSRFHVLSEFDKDKRSCRRRLAGHNQRRRKSQPEVPPPNPMPDTNVYGFADLSLPEGLSAAGSAILRRQLRDDVASENGEMSSVEYKGSGNCNGNGNLKGVDRPWARTLSLLSCESITPSEAAENNSLSREFVQGMNTFEHPQRAAALHTPGGSVQNSGWDSFPITCSVCSESQRMPHLVCRALHVDFFP